MTDLPTTVTGPGIYSVPADDYHADKIMADGSMTVGRSVIKRLIETGSPRQARQEHPRFRREKPGNEDPQYRFDLGSAFHDLMLEGGRKLRVIQADSWRTKDAKDARDGALAAGLLPVLPAQFDLIEEMAEAAREQLRDLYPDEAALLAAGDAEATVVWEDRGVICHSRPDWIPADRRPQVYLNWKTTGIDFTTGDIARLAADAGYDFNAAWYGRGLSSVVGGTWTERFIVLSTEPPYILRVVEPYSEIVDEWASDIDWALDVWNRCVETDEWPWTVVPTGRMSVGLPPWKAIERREMRDLREVLGTKGSEE